MSPLLSGSIFASGRRRDAPIETRETWPSQDVRFAKVPLGIPPWYSLWSKNTPRSSHGGALRRLAGDHAESGDRAGVPRARDRRSVVQHDRPALHHHGPFRQHAPQRAPRQHRAAVRAVRTVCDGQRLIGREMCAMDGVTLPSNASTHRSGTRAEFTPRTETWEAAAPTMLTGTARRTVCRTRAPDELAGSVARRVARGEAVAPGMCAE